MKKFRYFAPSAHVWVVVKYVRHPGTIVQRQSGVYRVQLDTGEVVLVNTRWVTERK